MKLCQDCRHFRMPSRAHLDTHEYAKCVHPALSPPPIISTVTGKPVAVASVRHYCVNQRMEHGGCGPDGELFEPADGSPEAIEEPFEPISIGQFGVR